MWKYSAAIATAAVLLAGCGGTDQPTTEAAEDAGGSGEAITILSPEDGASVEAPFTLKFDAGDIGPEETGKDHVHVFTDGEESDYTVVTENSFRIDGLSEGEHTITVTKQHADHSPTGDEAEITVDVTGGGSSGGDGGGGSDDSGYGY